MTNTKGQYKGESPNSPAIPEDSKYEAKVREIAEEMYFDNESNHIDIFEVDEPGRKEAIMKIVYMPAARIAQKHMAVEFAAGFNHNYDFTEDPEFGPDIVNGQVERGLIPSPEQRKEAGEI